MKRRRGEVSLFEILRQPEETSPGAGTTSGSAPSGKKRRSAVPETPEKGEAPDETRRAAGSSTPMPDEDPPPRLDVTPPSRASRMAARRFEAPPADEPVEEEAPAPTPAPRTAPAAPSAGLGEIDPSLRAERDEDRSAAPRWWERAWWESTIAIRPAILALATIGVILSWILVFQLGVGSVGDEQGRRDRFAGDDAPAWDVPILLPTPGRQPEIRNVEGSGEPTRLGPEEGLAAGPQRLPVVMVAQALPEMKAAEDLLRYVETYTGEGTVGITRIRGRYAVFVGPFDTEEEASAALEKSVQRIGKHRGTNFSEAYINVLEFTPDELRLLRRG